MALSLVMDLPSVLSDPPSILGDRNRIFYGRESRRADVSQQPFENCLDRYAEKHDLLPTQRPQSLIEVPRTLFD